MARRIHRILRIFRLNAQEGLRPIPHVPKAGQSFDPLLLSSGHLFLRLF